MKIGPDGSLPRITSSFKGIVNNIKIVKVPDDQIKESEPLYKPVWIGVENENELSDKSDEEVWSEEDTPNIPVENTEDSKKEGKVEESNPQKGQSVRRYNIKNNRYGTVHNQKNYNSGKRSFNASGKFHKNYDTSIASTSNMEQNNYKYFPNKRGFGNSGNFGRNYKKSTNSSIAAIEPWANPPVMMHTGPNFQYAVNSSYSYQPVIEQTPPNSNAENRMQSGGLLGDSPYSPYPTNYSLSSQDDTFTYTQEPWTNNEYHQYPPSNYQISSLLHAPRSVSSGHEGYYPRKKYWKNKSGKKPNAWNKNMRNASGHFDYRN